jgi:hypothetical protein
LPFASKGLQYLGLYLTLQIFVGGGFLSCLAATSWQLSAVTQDFRFAVSKDCQSVSLVWYNKQGFNWFKNDQVWTCSNPRFWQKFSPIEIPRKNINGQFIIIVWTSFLVDQYWAIHLHWWYLII